MKRGPRRQRSNGFLIHEGTDGRGGGRASPLGWPEIYGRRRGSPSHAWSGLRGSFCPLNLAHLKLSWYILRHSLARAPLSSCGDRIPRRPHRRVTFGIIILLSASSPSFLPSPPPAAPWDLLCSRWDELAFCSNRFRPVSTSSFHNFQIHLIFTP